MNKNKNKKAHTNQCCYRLMSKEWLSSIFQRYLKKEAKKAL